MRKRLFLLPLLAGCVSHSPWTLSHIKTGTPSCDSSRLAYRTTHRTRGVDVEILKTEQGEHVYLCVHAHTIPPYQEDTHRALVHLLWEAEERACEATRHLGGQKVLLPEQEATLLLSLLRNGIPVTIQLQGFSSQLPPLN